MILLSCGSPKEPSSKSKKLDIEPNLDNLQKEQQQIQQRIQEETQNHKNKPQTQQQQQNITDKQRVLNIKTGITDFCRDKLTLKNAPSFVNKKGYYTNDELGKLTFIVKAYAKDNSNAFFFLSLVLNKYLEFKKSLIIIKDPSLNTDKLLLKNHIDEVLKTFIRAMNDPKLNKYLPDQNKIKILLNNNKNNKINLPVWHTHVQMRFMELDNYLSDPNLNIEVWIPGSSPDKHNFGTGVGGGKKEVIDLFKYEINKLKNKHKNKVKFANWTKKNSSRVKEKPEYGVHQIHAGLTKAGIIRIMSWGANQYNWNHKYGNGGSDVNNVKNEFESGGFGANQAAAFERQINGVFGIDTMQGHDKSSLLSSSNTNHSLQISTEDIKLIFDK